MPLPPSGRISRSAPVNSGRVGWVYVVHFVRPIKTAAPEAHWPRHYTGWTETVLEARLADHAAGRGSVLFVLAMEQGIGWDLARAERGDRNRERQLKQSSASQRCLICRALARLQQPAQAAGRLLTESQPALILG
jgi:predicted GIY-YIG superfamily endonuclease